MSFSTKSTLIVSELTFFFLQMYAVRLGEQPPKVPGEDLGIKMRVEKVNATHPNHPVGTWI